MSGYAGCVCNTCDLHALDNQQLKIHYLSDWHRYNLKRKAADMPPVSLENFEIRVNEQKRKENAENEKNLYQCPYTGKVFKSEGAWKSYLKSKKYVQLAEKEAKQAGKETVELAAPLKPELREKERTWEEGDSPQKRWMYMMWCQAGDDEENWEDDSDDEMAEEEPVEASSSVQIEETEDMSESEDEEEIENPDEEFGEPPVELVAVKPLVDFFDNAKTRQFSTEDELLAALEKRYQFKIPEQKYVHDMPGLLEHIASKIGYGMTCIHCNKGFYSLEAVQQHMRETPGHARLNITGDNALELEDFYNFEELEEQQEFVESLEVENMQLVLPSGAKVGHKDMQKYYKQKFDYVPSGMEYSQLALTRARMGGGNKSRRMMLEHVLGRYKAIGWHQTGLAIKAENRDIRRVQTIRNKKEMRLGIKHNRVLMKHFRLQYQNAG